MTGIVVKDINGDVIKPAQYKYDVYNQRIAKTVQRHVAEVKIVTGSVKKPFLRPRDLNKFTVEGFADLRVAQQCNYSYSFVVSDDNFAKDLQQRFGSAIPVYTIPE